MLSPRLKSILLWIFWIAYFAIGALMLTVRYEILPHIDRYREDIAQGLSASLGLKVSIRAIDAHWQGFRPKLSLYGFQVFDRTGQPAFSFDKVDTELAWSSLLHQQVRLARLDINAPVFTIRREKDGKVYFAGIELKEEAEGAHFSDWLLAQRRVFVHNATLNWEDALHEGPPLSLTKLNFFLRNNGDRHRFGLTALPSRELAAQIDVRGDFWGADLKQWQTWKGKGYVELLGTDLSSVHSRIALPESVPKDLHGQGNLRLWFDAENKVLSNLNADISFKNIQMRVSDKLPLLSAGSISGHISGSKQGGKIDLQSQQLAFDLPKLLTDEHLNIEQGKIQASWEASGKDAAKKNINIKIKELAFENRDAAGTVSGEYQTRPDGPGEIDLTAHFTRAEGNAVWRYLPHDFSPTVRDWLHAGVLMGRSDDVRLRLKGDLRHFPFVDNKQGIFQVEAKISGVKLHYAEAWPDIDNIKGSLLFEGKHMLIHAQHAECLGVALSDVKARIDDLLVFDEILHVTGNAKGPTAGFLQYIESSPLAEKLDHATRGMKALANGSLKLGLNLPLRRLGESKIAGEYTFVQNQLTVDPSLPPLTKVNGTLAFNDKGITAKNIDANFLDSPMRLNAITQPDGSIAVNTGGIITASNIRKIVSHPLLGYLAGSAPWRGKMLIKKRNTEMMFESSLFGISSKLPEPFNKAANAVLPLRIERLSISGGNAFQRNNQRNLVRRDEIKIALGQAGSLLNAQFVRRHDGDQFIVKRAAIGIGERPVMPERGIVFSAVLNTLDTDLWRQYFTTKTPAAAASLSAHSPILWVNVRAKKLNASAHTLNDVSLRAVRKEADWQAQINSREVVGDVQWHGQTASQQNQGQIRARLRSLVLAGLPASQIPISPAIEPFVSLPSLDIVADNFVFRGKPLGKLELQAANEGSNIWRIENFTLSNADGHLASQGIWHTGSTSSTQFSFNLNTSDIGKFLARMGYPGSFKRGTSHLEGVLAWRGSPLDFDYRSVSGTLLLDVGRGQFSKAEPGVGRLLGILSLQALPRRITLDFRDIFSEGFAFESITGTAKINAGIITTQNLEMKGPAANIVMDGQLNVPNETQDLHVRVQPAIGESLAVGALFANPAAGVAAWIAQKVLKDPLGQIFAYDYTITGTWADPKVHKIEQQTVKPLEP